MLPQNHDRLPPTPPAPAPAAMPHKEPRYPVYLPPPLSSSVPTSSRMARQSQSLAAQRRIQRAIVPSTPLRLASSSVASERTPLLTPPNIPRRQRTQQQPRPKVETARTRAISPEMAKQGESSLPQRRRSLDAPPQPRPAPKPTVPKPFYRPRPLWLVPFAIIAALVRGMTLAPRVEVYTQLACYSLHAPHESKFGALDLSLQRIEWHPSSAISVYSSLDPLGPHLFPSLQVQHNVSTPVLIETSSDPRTLPSRRCLTDPAVQASAARLQTVMTTTMGLLSALTTSFWGRFSQSHGRTRVLAISTFGLFFTDLVFILASTPTLPWPLSLVSYDAAWDRHKHHILIVGPIVEGLLGGWTTLQSATSAYISDCTSLGSRAGIFSRFTGVFYVGFSIGPMIAGWIVRHPELLHFPFSHGSGGEHVMKKPADVQSVTGVFWIAIICSFINFLLVLFVFPESLDKVKQQQARDSKGKGRAEEDDEQPNSPVLLSVEDVEGVGGGDGFVDVEELRKTPISPSSSSSYNRSLRPPSIQSQPGSSSSAVFPVEQESQPNSIFSHITRPFSVFFPVYIYMPTRNSLTLKRRPDFSITFLALGLFFWMLSTGAYQIKYLYAEHTYGWGAEELSWYISWMGFVRAVVLLGGIPWVIKTFKPKMTATADSEGGSGDDGKGKQRAVDEEVDENDGKKAEPTRLQLGKNIRFDLRLARASLLVDLVSNILIAATPSPAYRMSLKYYLAGRHGSPMGNGDTHAQSQALFVLASSLSALGGGLVPAVHSLALCIVQARSIAPDFGINDYGLRDLDDVQSAAEDGYRSVRDESRASSVRSSVGSSTSGTTPFVPTPPPSVDTGTLFGAFALLQATAQMILAPMLFGLVYSSTVANYPKTVFILSSGLLMVSIVLMLVVKNPVGEVRIERRDKRFRRTMERQSMIRGKALHYQHPPHSGGKMGGVVSAKINATRAKAMMVKEREMQKRWEADIERRGRSRRNKDLRGGAVPVSIAFYGDRGVRVGEGGSADEGALVTRSA